jgi:hypothetical protein
MVSCASPDSSLLVGTREPGAGRVDQHAGFPMLEDTTRGPEASKRLDLGAPGCAQSICASDEVRRHPPLVLSSSQTEPVVSDFPLFFSRSGA